MVQFYNIVGQKCLHCFEYEKDINNLETIMISLWSKKEDKNELIGHEKKKFQKNRP